MRLCTLITAGPKHPIVIRYVYDAASFDSPASEAPDPDRPTLKRNSEDNNISAAVSTRKESGAFRQHALLVTIRFIRAK